MVGAKSEKFQSVGPKTKIDQNGRKITQTSQKTPVLTHTFDDPRSHTLMIL